MSNPDEGCINGDRVTAIPSFFTFGMFIIDEIVWQTPNPSPPKYNLIGGAGTYAVLGARLVASTSNIPHPNNPAPSHSISWIVDKGSDFPAHITNQLSSWSTSLTLRHDSARLTTRAWNGYGANEHRAFKYLTPKRRLEVGDLSREQILSQSFHMVCSAERCLDICEGLGAARGRVAVGGGGAGGGAGAGGVSEAERPVVVWEPIPDLCSPEELENMQRASKGCTVVSPNADELRSFFTTEEVARASQEELVVRFMGWDKSCTTRTFGEGEPQQQFPIAIVREGADGSTAYLASAIDGKVSIKSLHVPAYHDNSMSDHVIDPTGGGNTYLGALAFSLSCRMDNCESYELIERVLRLPQGMQRTNQSRNLSKKHNCKPSHEYDTQTILTAMIRATIAASFAIEQHGVPELDLKTSLSNGSRLKLEVWGRHRETFMARLQGYLEREKEAIMTSHAVMAVDTNSRVVFH